MTLRRNDIEVAAHQTRHVFERHPNDLDRDLLVNLYSEYNPTIDDPDLFVEAAIRSFPIGACGLASVYNKHLLGGQGEVVYGKYVVNERQVGHTILVLAELGLISCVTADQFGGPPVYVGALKEPWLLS